MDPNFPKDLDIKPLKPTKFGSITTAAFDDDFDYQAQQDAIQAYGIAGRVWEAAHPMILYLNPPASWSFDPPQLFKEKDRTPFSILELGSGTGITASCMAGILLEKDLLIVTDLPEVCPLLEKNLSKHAGRIPQLAVRPLAWGNAEHVNNIRKEFQPLSLTHIVCSDLVYFPELLAPLLRSLIHLTSLDSPNSSAGPTIIISYMIRSLTKEAPFWSSFGLWFKFYPVTYQDTNEGCNWRPFGSTPEDRIFIFVAQRRSQSHHWVVPDSDQELLQGVGANCTPTPKSDDAFEILLLLSVQDCML